jgi:hypothetical protein
MRDVLQADLPVPPQFPDWDGYHWGCPDDSRWEEGGCYKFALALQDLTGLPAFEMNLTGTHCVLRDKDGNNIDHTGYLDLGPRKRKSGFRLTRTELKRHANRYGKDWHFADATIAARVLAERLGLI